MNEISLRSENENTKERMNVKLKLGRKCEKGPMAKKGLLGFDTAKFCINAGRKPTSNRVMSSA